MMRRTWVMTGIAVALVASLAAAQPPRGKGRGGFGGGGMQGGPVALLRMEEVRKELNVTDEQKSKVDELMEEMRQNRPNFNFQELQDLSEAERQKKMEEFRKQAEQTAKQAEEKLSKILDAKQMERLGQLRLQREGIMAVMRSDVATKVGLTQEQQEKLKKIQEEARPRPPAGNFQDLSEDERRELFTKMRERQQKARADMEGVLTEEQKTKLNEMKGKEFAFPAQQGFGGAGGGGGGERKRPSRKKDGG